MAVRTLLLILTLVATPATVQAHKRNCDELRAQIDAKLQSRGVTGYSLDIVEAADTGSASIVGTCDGGSHRIVYARGGGRSSAVAAKPKASTVPRRKAAPVPAIGNY